MIENTRSALVEDAARAAEAGAGAKRRCVAIVCADFAPSNLPTSLRLRFFSRYLPEFGWQPVIITTDPRYYEHPVDRENENLLPEALEIIRTPAFPATLTRKFGIGDVAIRSMWHHWRALARLCRQRQIDLFFTTLPPNMTMALGRLAHARFGIPYVLDYNDPVVTDFYWKLPRSQRPPKWPLVHAMWRMVEPFSLRQVGHLVTVDRSYLAGVYSRCPWVTETDTTGILFGAEPADFDYVRMHPRPNKIFDPKDGLLHVSYIGRGGADMNPTLRVIFSAVKQGLERRPEIFRRIRLHFVGTTYAANGAGKHQVLPIAREFDLAGVVDEHPARVAYLDSIQLQLDSHALLLVGSECAHYTASKVFPNILSRRPLLAVVHHESSVVSVLERTRAGEVVTFGPDRPVMGCVADISQRLEGLLLLPPGYHPPIRWDEFEPYTARAITARLAQVFDNVLNVRRRNEANP